MRRTDHLKQPDRYEVTVVGPIGPVLRRALEPCTTEPVQLLTIVRARAHPDVDLVDLAQRLRTHGSTVAAIRVLHDGATGSGS